MLFFAATDFRKTLTSFLPGEIILAGRLTPSSRFHTVVRGGFSFRKMLFRIGKKI